VPLDKSDEEVGKGLFDNGSLYLRLPFALHESLSKDLNMKVEELKNKATWHCWKEVESTFGFGKRVRVVYEFKPKEERS